MFQTRLIIIRRGYSLVSGALAYFALGAFQQAVDVVVVQQHYHRRDEYRPGQEPEGDLPQEDEHDGDQAARADADDGAERDVAGEVDHGQQDEEGGYPYRGIDAEH